MRNRAAGCGVRNCKYLRSSRISSSLGGERDSKNLVWPHRMRRTSQKKRPSINGSWHGATRALANIRWTDLADCLLYEKQRIITGPKSRIWKMKMVFCLWADIGRRPLRGNLHQLKSWTFLNRGRHLYTTGLLEVNVSNTYVAVRITCI